MAGHRVDHPFHHWRFSMTPPRDPIPLPHLPRELREIVEPGQNIEGARKLYTRVSNGELPMIIFDNGRWKCPEPELPALAEALGLRLKSSSLPLAAEPDAEPNKPAQNPSMPRTAGTTAKPEPTAKASKPARPRTSTRRSAA
jgi:hypothetical protein